MDTPKEIIEKLRKLLRLGESSNMHEAELAMQRAQEIATKWRISLSELSETEQNAEAYTREDRRRKRTFHQRFVDWIVRKHFNVHVILKGDGGVWYVGKPSDIEFAKFVNDYLCAEFPRQWGFFRKTCGAAHMHTFFHGMWKGLDEKLTEARKATEAREFIGRPDAANKYALVVVSDQRALASAVHGFFPRLGRGGRGNLYTNNAASFAGGHAAGRNVNISRPLGGGRAPIASLR
jgi:hypothetical protein